jgi:hypothetical protein
VGLHAETYHRHTDPVDVSGDDVAGMVSSYALPSYAGAGAAAGGEEDDNALASRGQIARSHRSRSREW